MEPKHLFWGLLFLQVYDTEENLAQSVGEVDEKTFQKWSHLFVNAISYLECEVVSSFEFHSLYFIFSTVLTVILILNCKADDMGQ